MLSLVRAARGGPLYFVILDIAAWVFAVSLGTLVRFDFDPTRINFAGILGISALAALLQLAFGLLNKLYRERSRAATFEELKALALTAFYVAIPLSVATWFVGSSISVPRGSVLIALPTFVLVSGGIRAFVRNIQGQPQKTGSRKRALLYGAGVMAEALIPQFLNDPKTQYLPVGLIDDDRAKRRRWINNVPVLGTWNDLEKIHQATSADVLVVCIARIDAEVLRRVELDCRRLGMKVIVLPPLDDVLQGRYALRDLRDISIEDIIGRRPIETDLEGISAYLTDKKVLVTGAGGSIGAELCRQISTFSPSQLMMLDRDESGLQLAQISVSGHGLLDSGDVLLADIRDDNALREIFLSEQPDVVFHAAALKHLPLLERYPDEAWKTNVLGTLNVLTAAREAGVTTFINISTDKAADPTSVLGSTKKLTEGLTSWFGQETSATYLSVRFGNVLGSRGSLVPTFTSLIERGGPLTITHPEVTRYFMTIPEACQLVLQAGALGSSQDVLILDMGQPVKILDIANKMIEISGKKIEIVYTGLRPGEKLHEELFGSDEAGELVHQNLISRSFAPPVAPTDLDRSHIS